MAEADPHLKDRLLNDLSSSIDSRQSEPLVEAPAPPPTIPDHTLLRRIGKGSYGEVWLARNVMGTFRAVKVVYRRAFDSDRPYEREFTGIRRFEPVSRTHPSQLNVLHVGRDDAAGYFYYVMELADDVTPVFQPANDAPPAAIDSPTGKSALCTAGVPTGTVPTAKAVLQPDTYSPRTLRSELQQRGALPHEECLAIGTALATALDHLHRHGLVHRDIKPSNIIFVNGIPKLADIGLVTHVEASLSFVGTEGFVPPEGPGTPGADIYSLGKVLYEMSTGRDRQEYPELPTNLISRPEAERAALEELNEVILRACHSDPKQRYATAAELHADLALLQSGKSVTRMRRVERRLRLVARAGALVTVLALLAGVAFFYQRHATQEARRFAGINRALADEKASLATEKAKLADGLAQAGEENRQRIVRRDVADGIRVLDEGDPTGALLWFADALKKVTNTSEEIIHRIRIQQTLNQSPRILQVLTSGELITTATWSGDGRGVIIGTDKGKVCIWDLVTGQPRWDPVQAGSREILQIRPSPDGQRIFVSELFGQGLRADPVPTNKLVMINADTGRELLSLTGTNWTLTGISADYRWLAIADLNHVIHIHDAIDGRELAQLRGHTDRIHGMEFSPAADLLVSFGEDRTVQFWRVPSGELALPPLHFENAPAGPVRFSPDGRSLAVAQSTAAADTGSRVELWDLRVGKQVIWTTQMVGPIGILAFVPPAGKRLLVGTDKDAGLFEVTNGERLPQRVPVDGTTAFASSPDGRDIAFVGAHSQFSLWNLDSAVPVAQVHLGEQRLISLDVSPEGSRFLALRDDGTLFVLGLPSPQGMQTRHLPSPVGSPGLGKLRPWLSADHRRFLLRRDQLFSMLDLDELTVWEVPMPEVAYRESGWGAIDRTGRQCAIHYRPEQDRGSHFIDIWREEEQVWKRVRIQFPAELCDYPHFSPDGSHLTTLGRDCVARVWRTKDGLLEQSYEYPRDLGLGILFPDGQRALTAQPENKGWQILDLATGAGTTFRLEDLYDIAGLAFSPTGVTFAPERVEKEGGTQTRVLDSYTGNALTPALELGGPLTWTDFSPDGRKLLTAGLTPNVRVWNVETGERLLQLNLGSQPLRAAQWSLDGRFIVARSDDHSVRVWDSTTGEAVTPILKHSGYVRYAILGQRNRLITVSQPDLMNAWELTECALPADVVLDYAKLLSGRYLNAAGLMEPIGSKEWAELCGSLRQRAPELFR